MYKQTELSDSVYFNKCFSNSYKIFILNCNAKKAQYMSNTLKIEKNIYKTILFFYLIYQMKIPNA